MKKTSTAITSIATLLYCTASLAQPLLKGKQEIALSYGYVTFEQTKTQWGTFPYYKMKGASENFVSDYLAETLFHIPGQPLHIGDMRYSGAPFVTYIFNPDKKFALAIGSGIEIARASFTTSDTISNTDKKIGTFRRTAFTIAPELLYFYNTNRKLRLYLLLGIGSTFIFERLENTATGEQKPRNDSYYTFQVTPLGIKVGGKLSAFAELGFGYKGIVRAGASYKF